MKLIFWRMLAVMLVVTAAHPEEISAQSAGTGTIAGRVMGDDGQPLYDAAVVLLGSSRGATTNRQGYFQLSDVPAGARRVVIQHLGYAADTTAVAVSPGQSVEVAVDLKLAPFAIEGVVATAISRSQVQALNEMRTAVNIKNVIAEEQFQRMPDLSVADALARVPGVGSTFDAATGYLGYEAGTQQTSSISLRGMSGGTSVTVDGQSVPSTSTSGRDAELAGIALQSLEAIEVTKAITPDMDADAIGGSINLRTRRPSVPRITGSLAGSYNGVAGDPNIQGSLGYEARFGNTGIMLDGNYSSATSTYDLVTNSWGLRDFGQGQERVLSRFTFLTASGSQERMGGTATLQHQLSNTASVYVRGATHRYLDSNFSQFLQLRPGGGRYVSLTEATGATAHRRIQYLPTEVNIYNVAVGGDKSFSRAEMDFSAGYSRSARSTPEDWGSFENVARGINMTWDRSDPLFTQYNITNNVQLANPSAFPMSSIQRRDDETRDGEFSAGFNVGVPLVEGAVTLDLKAGGKFNSRDRSRDYTRNFRNLPSGRFTMDRVTDGTDLTREITPGGYRLGMATEWGRVEEFLSSNDGVLSDAIDQSQSDAGDHTAREDVSAGYGMLTMNLNKLMLLGGVRYEHTENTYVGNQTVFGARNVYQGTRAVESSSSKGGVFPMMHVKYSVNDRTNFRVAFTSTIERPPFDQVAPTENINYEGESISRGNPDLDPARSQNFDVLGETYFRSGGILSGGLFYKSIRDFGAQTRTTIVGGEFDGFDLVQWQNTGKATVWGVEASMVQGLQFLPGVFKYLSVNANYAYAHSRIQFGEDRELPMTNQAPHIVNAALNLDYRGLQATGAASYQSEKLAHIGTDPMLDMYLYRPIAFDFSVRQSLRNGLQLFGNLRNATGAPSYTFSGSRDFPQRATYTSYTATAGVRVDF